VVRKDLEDLARGREQFEIDQKDLLQFKRSVDERVASAEAAEAAAAAKTEELNAREARLAPLEAELEAREARAREADGRAGAATRGVRKITASWDERSEWRRGSRRCRTRKTPRGARRKRTGADSRTVRPARRGWQARTNSWRRGERKSTPETRT